VEEEVILASVVGECGVELVLGDLVVVDDARRVLADDPPMPDDGPDRHTRLPQARIRSSRRHSGRPTRVTTPSGA
jgi:hypothetical protein